MSIFTKQKLSGSTNGKPIKIDSISSPGTTIHTSVSGETSFDEIWLWASNTDTSARKLTIEFGGTTSPDDLIELTIPSESGLSLIVPGLVLQNSLVVKAFASTANVLNIVGYVNRISN